MVGMGMVVTLLVIVITIRGIRCRVVGDLLAHNYQGTAKSARRVTLRSDQNVTGNQAGFVVSG